MLTGSEAYNAITEKLRSYGLNSTQLQEVCRMLNAFWDAVDSEVRVNELPTD